jgi:hypothetical protein
MQQIIFLGHYFFAINIALSFGLLYNNNTINNNNKIILRYIINII